MSEPIKIIDKVTLRQEALRLAVATGSAYPLSAAVKFEAYIRGKAELPEYVDPNAQTKQIADIFAKTRESFNPTPLPMWIPADSEMKPAKDSQVLVICKDYGNYPLLAEYLGKDNWDVFDADVTKNTLRCEIEVASWMPIPPYEPTKE